PTTFSKGFTVNVTLSDGRVMTLRGGVGQTARRGRILAMPAIELELPAPLLYSYDQTAWQPWNYQGSGIPEVLPNLNTTNRAIYLKDNPESSTPGITRAHLQSIADKFRKDAATEETFTLTMNSATLAGTTEFPSDIFCGACWNGTVNTAKADYALKLIIFPSNMTRIADTSIDTTPSLVDMLGAFCGNHGLVTVGLQGGVTYIGSGAFALCNSLKSVLITGADGELTIGKYAFRISSALADVRIARTTPPKLVFDESGRSPFYGAGTSGIVFRVPAASLAAYRADPSWQKVIAEGANRTWAVY
uniref:leucine-rich repeat protein n=1 Tax=Alistipes sp. TaxID=1872444 RepID=UPI003AEF44AD